MDTEGIFTRIVEQIFNNWTALKLAVEHSLGGPNSLQVAKDIKDYMVKYCLYESNIDTEDIQDALEEIMDEEFQTICEDNSTKEIASILKRFMQLLKENNVAQCELEFNNLPKASVEWLTAPQVQQTIPVTNCDSSDSSPETDNVEVSMDEDPEWTTVKSRRKR